MRKLFASVACVFIVTAWAARADEASQYELLLDIPTSGVLRTTVDRSVTRAMNGRQSTLVARYEIIENYSCFSDETCSIIPRTGSTTLVSIDGVAPPAGLDTSTFTRPFQLMDGVKYSSDSSFYPTTIEDLNTLKAHYADIMMAEASGQSASSSAQEGRSQALVWAERTISALGGADSASVFIPERTLVSWPHNTALVVGEPITDTVAYSSPLDGSQLAINVTMTLVSWNSVDKIAVVEFSQRPDETAMAAYVDRLTPRLRSLAGTTQNGDTGQGTLVIKNDIDCRYEVSTATGLVNKAQCRVEKGVRFGNKDNITTEVFLLSEALLP